MGGGVMAVQGRKPKEEGRRVNRTAPSHEWTEVEDRPFAKSRRPVKPPMGIPPATRAWWDRVTTLPHCVLWTQGDWQFALDTARVHAAFVLGDYGRAPELRLREKQMGTTLDARRDLRIRYVEPEKAERAPRKAAANPVADFEAERRKRLSDDG
jgi:hypothetical protein